jgi:hypothetical protein
MRLLVLLGAVAIACGGCGHVGPARDKAGTYFIAEDASGVGSALGTGGSGYDCDDELNRCFTRCWESSRQPYPHVEHDEWYYEYCTKTCRKEYMQCIDEKEKAEIALGTVVIVAGTTFILATGGAGALILAPLAL